MEKKDSMDFLGPIKGLSSNPEPPPLVHTLYEQLTETWQYIVADPVSRHAVIIDPHLDNGTQSVTNPSTIAADRALSVVRQNRYTVDRILHTHEPTTHPSSAWYLRTQLLQTTGRAPQVQIGRKMQAVERVFRRKYSMNDGSAWKSDFSDENFQDGETFPVGNLSCRVVHLLRGNLAFVIGNHIFAGTSRFDFEVRTRHEMLVGSLKDYHVYGSRDLPPPPEKQRVQLAPVFEEGSADGKSVKKGRKLVIRYAAQGGS